MRDVGDVRDVRQGRQGRMRCRDTGLGHEVGLYSGMRPLGGTRGWDMGRV